MPRAVASWGAVAPTSPTQPNTRFTDPPRTSPSVVLRNQLRSKPRTSQSRVPKPP